MAIVGWAKYTHARGRNFEGTQRERSAKFGAFLASCLLEISRTRVCVYFASPTIAIDKIRHYSQSNPQNFINSHLSQKDCSLFTTQTVRYFFTHHIYSQLPYKDLHLTYKKSKVVLNV